ncbi:2-methylisoborneol synthase [Nocardia transvalensis]|uniref:2-methylisoborneol synthase n=1 Tax=Nocardia transvalensis TaxID=37333 RepID=A0A7W9UMF6_9NOCA|nr:family 2 encapsulin nanocompartment cargo protein terpene cyclase [Nocardia transvalensis]MBB5917700.1 2-methylisoborneol synthase [Nocardia transvalensis]
MSVLSRAAAPQATGEVAAVVAALLTNLDHAPPARLRVPGESDIHAAAAALDDVAEAVAPRRLLGPTGLGAPGLLPPPDPPPAPSPAVDRSVTERASSARIPFGPTGIGTTSLRPRLPSGESAPVSAPSGGNAPAGHTGTAGGESRIPPLYCPPPVRDNPSLAEAVNEGILRWAESIGLYEGRLDELRKADFGRLIMLAHPDCDDPDRLLAAAKCAVSEWSVDDYYCEEDADDHAPDGTPSSAEAELGPRLELAAAAMDPVHLPARYQVQLERALRADPILRAFRTSFEHLAHYATPTQLARLRTEIGGWFIALGAEAGWRTAGRMPPVWEYLTNRQPHSFLPCMAPIDVVGGYELSAPEYTDPRVRRVVTTAALASQMVNDLYSMAREDLSGGREFNLPTVLAAEEDCPRSDAVRRTAQVHDELVHRFEREAAALAGAGSPELRRFLGGLWAWMGGNRAWHADSRRYHDQS